jgi:opacity protein-like surface antigen
MKTLLTALALSAVLAAPALAEDQETSVQSGGTGASATVKHENDLKAKEMAPNGQIMVPPGTTTGSGGQESGLSTQEGGAGASVKLNPEDDKGGKDADAGSGDANR